MYIKQGVSVGNLLLDLHNYRITKQTSQKSAREAIIAEQGTKLVKLASDIIEHGLNPFDLPMIVDAEDGQHNFTVVEGNRRLTAINLLLDPELAKDTPIHTAFVKLNKNHNDAIPKVIDCVIAPNKQSALIWINRKHANGLDGAGTEHWSSMSKARADVEQGISRPSMEIVNFVLAQSDLAATVRQHLEGAKFNITTLDRLVSTSELQNAAGFTIQSGKPTSETNENWLKLFLTDLVTTIALGQRKGQKFTERDVDAPDKREHFIAELVKDHPKKPPTAKEWNISGTPKPTSIASKPAVKASGTKSTVSTEDQPNLIPRKFKLELPSGKVNDIFIELRKLDVVTYRHSVSVLMRVFIELTIQQHIDFNSIDLPKDKAGYATDKLSTRLRFVLEHIEKSNLLAKNVLKPVRVALDNKDSLLAPDTLNSYVHSPWMNPDPLQLKLAWANIQPFVEFIWAQKK